MRGHGRARARRARRMPKLPTGADRDSRPASSSILNEAEPLPFQLDDEAEETVDETLRLKYRYLDMRRPAVLRASPSCGTWCAGPCATTCTSTASSRSRRRSSRARRRRARATSSCRAGCRPGRFYALPQSPQLFKQLLMVAGFERYFQIVRCFRDEDLRADRQPEFTQIDIETSFLDRDDFLPIIEGLVAEIWRRVKGVELALPVPRGSATTRRWRASARTSPTSRFGLELTDVLRALRGGGLPGLRPGRGAQGGAVKALAVPGRRRDVAARSSTTCERGQAGRRQGARLDQGRRRGPCSRRSPSSSEAIQEPLLARRAARRRATSCCWSATAGGCRRRCSGACEWTSRSALELIPDGRDVFAWVIDFPLVRVERGREALGRRPPSVHGAAGRGPARARAPIPGGRAPRRTTSC